MSETLKPANSAPIRRRRPRLPSLWRHIGVALLTLCIAIGLISGYVLMFGDANDAKPDISVVLEQPPLPPAFDNLNAQNLDGTDAQTLPDLLGDDIPLGENPTQALARSDDLAGSETLTPATTRTGPKTILIDGEPLTRTGRAPLIKAPIQGFTRQSPFGLIPAPSADGRRALEVYARPQSPVDKPVALIIGGLGINRTLTQKAITSLPPEVTLSFAAHARDLQGWIDQARANGHEVMIELPLESENFDPAEPGAERTLKAEVDAGRNIRHLDWLLSRAQGYFAVTNYNGDVFLNRTDAAAPVLTHLANAGLGFIYDGSATTPSLAALAQTISLPYTRAFTLIDATPASVSITTELARLSQAAQDGEPVIGVGFTYPETLNQVADWATDVKLQGLTLVPASYILNPSSP